HFDHGDSKGKCPVVTGTPNPIPVPDPIIEICHKNSDGTKSTINIKSSEWISHFDHGDSKGKCPVIEKKIDICHYPPGNISNPQRIQIPESAWPAHQAHGDTQGDCPTIDPVIEICHKNPDGTKSTINIKSSEWINHFDHGDSKGKCPVVEKKIDICHYPPGNKNNPQNININESAWPAHQKHGDSKGKCPNIKINKIAPATGTKVTPSKGGVIIAPTKEVKVNE
ncbi:MAG: hypothetical protein J5I47_11980, partial [Vicingus serpentipes]|nr:hypothetical protein [Vicingus serpentipes]